MTDETSQATVRENRKLRVGLLGCGNVGTGLVNYFLSYGNDKLPGYELVAVGIKDKDKPRNIGITVRELQSHAINLPKFTIDCEHDIINNPQIDVIVDTVGGDRDIDAESMRYTEHALASGKNVVTSNKQNLLSGLANLTDLANRNEVNLRYEPAVCGGVPIIRTMRDYFAGDEITKIVGVINGTSNYILTRLAKGGTLEDAVREAIKAGIAEKNPKSDLNGKDAAAKLAILASIAYNTKIHEENIECEGITHLGEEDQFVMKRLSENRGKYHCLKSIAVARRVGDNLELRVRPAFISEEHPLFGIDNSTNGIAIVGRHSGTYVLKGPGAGTEATSYAVTGDLLELEQLIRDRKFKNFSDFSRKYDYNKNLASTGYIRSTSPENLVGVFAEKFKIVAEHGINVYDSFNFPEDQAIGEKELLPDIMCIKQSEESSIRRTINDLKNAKIGNEGIIFGDIVYIPEDKTR